MSNPAEQAKSIFLDAIEKLAPEQRPAFLEQACAGDVALRAAIEKLLHAQAELGSFHESPWPLHRETVDEPIRERPGTLIGPYKLLEQIGEGGFGVVFMAEQTQPVRRRVALKVLKPGMDTRQVVARFEAERQALALMEHPNIARIFDGGETVSGRPYFVMELVRGISITDFCDQNHLSVRARLDLFVSVCQAVQHAHQKGIIHRDLKPTNVLVTMHDGAPVAKVIDFGIAKATGQQLTEKTLFTNFAQLIGTPMYMSPEQAQMSAVDVDTRSDIYSLGVLLYELLTGTTPFDRDRLRTAAFDEIRRMIREEEPVRPSTRLSTMGQAADTISANRHSDPKRLSQLCRGELDWIVMKALDKDRNRRYETASGLAMDVQRYLNNDPVQACPPTATYRFRKFARRNKGALATVLVVAVALLVAVGGVAGGFGWVARDRAARQATTEHEVNLAIKEAKGLLHQGRYAEALSVAKRAEVILAGGGSAELRERARELQKDVQMALRLDEIRLPEKDIPGAIENRDVQYAQAFREYGIDVESLEPQQAAEQVVARTIRPELIVALDNWANERKATKQPADTSWKRLIAVARAADPDEWRNRVRDAIEQGRTEVLRDLAASPRISTLPMQTLELLGAALHHAGVEQDVAFLRAVQRQYPGDFQINFKLAWALEHRQCPEWDEAIRFYTAALALRPQNALVRVRLAQKFAAKGSHEEAISLLKAAISLSTADKSEAYFVQAVALGRILLQQQNFVDAEPIFREALTLHEQKDPDDAREFNLKALLGGSLLGQKKYADAEPLLLQGYEGMKQREAKMPLQFRHVRLTESLVRLVQLYDALGKPDEAAKWRMDLGLALERQGKLEEAVACYKKAIELDPSYALAHNKLGHALVKQAKLDEAIACYCKYIEVDPKNAGAHHELAFFLSKQKRLDEAIACYQKALELEPKNSRHHNSLAWLLATCADAKLRDPQEAVKTATKAVELAPKDGNYWNTLGVAQYRAENFKEALVALEKSMELRKGGDSFDWFFLAMAHWQLGEKKKARDWYDRAVQWMDKNQPENEELRRFRTESAELLDVKEKM